MNRLRLNIFLSYIIFMTFLPLAGCSPGTAGSNLDLRNALISDAKSNLQATIAEDFTHLTIIKGSLGKFLVNKNNPQHLGAAIGATESMVFPEKYEIVRLTKMIDITADMKKDIISQPMLDIIFKNREVMNHIYNSVLQPLAAQTEKGKTAATEQLLVVNQVVRLLEQVAMEYRSLSQPGTDFNGNEAQASFMKLQDLNRELQKQKLPELKQ
ncbi:MAG: hypothetical protein ACOY4Q_08120 [Bacillota bacterium]